MRNKTTLWAWCAIVGLAVFANCQKRAVAPVAIAPEDMCSFCKMAISEKQYAAELLGSDEQAFKFDDIGCMLNFVRKQSVNVSAASFFVMDFDQRKWLKAEAAYYVRSQQLKTPMNGGIIAFADQTKAQAAAAKYQGKLLRFKELLF